MALQTPEPPLCTRELNVTMQSGSGDTESGAVMYIIAVLTFYSLGIVVMIVKYLKTERKEMEEEIVLENFFKGIPHKRIEHERDAVNRVAIQAFHTLTAAKERQTLHSARSSYTDSPSRRESEDDPELGMYEEESEAKVHSHHKLHPCDVMRHEMVPYRHSSYDDLGRYQELETGMADSRLSLQEGKPRRHIGRPSFQSSKCRLVDEGSFRGSGPCGGPRYGDRNETIKATNEMVEHQHHHQPLDPECPSAGEGRGANMAVCSTCVGQPKPSLLREDSREGHVPSKAHRVSFDTDSIVINSEAVGVPESPPHISRHRQRPRQDERVILVHAKQLSSDDAPTRCSGLPVDPGMPRSRTADYVGTDVGHIANILCSCALCQESVRRSEVKEKKKDRKLPKPKLKIPQISITRSSTQDELDVPVRDDRAGKSYNTAAENQPSSKQWKKPIKLTFFSRSSSSGDKKGNGPKVSGSKHTAAKASHPKEEIKDTGQRRRSGTMAEQARLLSDSQSYDSSSSLLPRRLASLSDDSAQSSPAKSLRASSSNLNEPGSVEMSENTARRESLPVAPTDGGGEGGETAAHSAMSSSPSSRLSTDFSRPADQSGMAPAFSGPADPGTTPPRSSSETAKYEETQSECDASLTCSAEVPLSSAPCVQIAAKSAEDSSTTAEARRFLITEL